MKDRKKIIHDTLYTLINLTLCFTLCLLIQNYTNEYALIPSVFILGVFLTSVMTDGYIYGIISSLLSVLAVNYAFTLPYFKLTLNSAGNLISVVIMLAITIITCTRTSRLKEQDIIKAESEREKTRADLLRAMSHDIRTPLTTIYGSSSALLDKSNEFTKEQKTKMLKSIQEESQWLFRMMENLLSITKLDNPNVKIIKTPTLLDELVDSVLIKFHNRYPHQHVNIKIPEDFAVVPMDATLIEQVMINILENAVQHAVGMTEITIELKLNSEKAIFKIYDNGKGISPDRLKYIFNGSTQQHIVSTDCKRSNAGIGLSMCATIIKAHGGEIKAENLKQGGACFTFSLSTDEEVG